MAWTALIPILAPKILEIIDGMLASGEITQDQYDEAKEFFTNAKDRVNDAVEDFEAWLNEQ